MTTVQTIFVLALPVSFLTGFYLARWLNVGRDIATLDRMKTRLDIMQQQTRQNIIDFSVKYENLKQEVEQMTRKTKKSDGPNDKKVD